jgi:hypothetical protein
MRVYVRLAVALVVALIFVGFKAPSSSALESYFYCSLKPVGVWCDGKANGTYDGLNGWDYLEAWYPGDWNNTVTACERAINPSTGVVLGGGGSCQLNWTSQYYGNISGSWEAQARQYSGGPHTIWGYANSSF